MATPTSGPRWRKTLRPGLKGLRSLLIAYLVVVGIAMFLENRLIFIPTKYPGGNWRPFGLDFEDAWFQSSDGTRLHGWYVAHPKPLATVLFCHGNAGNVTHREEMLRGLRNVSGASVLVFDYRGYGRSEGSPNEKGLLADARAARTWLAQRTGVPEAQIVLMGESLGGAVAVDLAAEQGARALVLDSTFTNLPDVAAYHMPWLPVRLVMRTRLDAAGKIGRYQGPLLQIHGDGDTVVPYWLGRRLFERANEPKEFVTTPEGDHNDLRSEAYYKKVREFFEGLGISD